MVAEIEIEIHDVAEKSKQAEITLEKGCDAYLDEALFLKERFEPIINSLRVLNEHTMDAFNVNGEEVYSRILPRMQPLYESCLRNISHLKSEDVAEALIKLIEEFEIQASQLKENQLDIQMIHKDIPEDEELQYLLSQL